MKKIIIIAAVISASISTIYTIHLVKAWKDQHANTRLELRENYTDAYRNTKRELTKHLKEQTNFAAFFSISPSSERIEEALKNCPNLMGARYYTAGSDVSVFSAGRKEAAMTFPNFSSNSDQSGWIGVIRGHDSYSLYGFCSTPIYEESQKKVKGYLVGCYKLPKTAMSINNLIYTFNSFGEIQDANGGPVVNPFLYTKVARKSANNLITKPEYSEPLPHTNGWRIVFHLKGGDLIPENIPMLKKRLVGEGLWAVTILLLLAILLKAHKGSTLSLSILSVFFILNCLFVTGYITSRFLASSQLDHENADDMKKIYGKIAEHHDDAIIIPTLVQIENIDFIKSSSYVLSGFIQQTYPKDYKDPVGILFPDELKTSSSKVTQISKIEKEDRVIYIWQFTLEMGKLFHLKDFPFDRRTLDLVMWPISMNKRVLFIPDTVGYEDMMPGTLPGVSSAVKVDNWEIDHSFFSLNYRQFPTFENERLPFNTQFKIVIQRSLTNAFLTNLTPLFICTILTYALLCVPLKKIENPTLHAMSIVLATIFVVTLNQTAIRTSLGIHSFAYIEFIYTAYYILLLLMTVNFILFTTSKKPFFMIGYRNNLIPKLLYWPVLTGVLAVVMYMGFV